MKALDAALTLDPDFLAAQLLREKILASGGGAVQVAETPTAAADDLPLFPVKDPGTSLDERARRKRIERQTEVAREAIDHGRWAEAQTALHEIQKLEREVEVSPLVSGSQAGAPGPHRHSAAGAWLAAAAVFGQLVLGDWTLEPHMPPATGTTTENGEPSSSEPAVNRGDAVSEGGGRVDRARGKPQRSARATGGDANLAAAESLGDSSQPVSGAVLPAQANTRPLPAERFETPVAASNAAVVDFPPTSSPAPISDAASDDQRIRDVLHTFRLAYGRLDARLAREVWPGVNQAALARAFDGLQSQALVFDACRVEVRGTVATASCQGTASYVPKIGSQYTRIESRNWDFTLRKRGVAWEIETARDERQD